MESYWFEWKYTTYVTTYFSSAEDEEDTIAAQEVIEGDGDHAEELDDLTREGIYFLGIAVFFIYI